MRTRIKTLLTLSLLTAGASAMAVPVTTTFRDGVTGYSGTGDTYLEQVQSNRNYGGLGLISAGYSDTRGVQKTLVRFDLSALDDGLAPGESISITSASIDFTLAIDPAADINVGIYSIASGNAGWGEGNGGGGSAGAGEAAWDSPDNVAAWVGGAGLASSGVDSFDPTAMDTLLLTGAPGTPNVVTFNLDVGVVEGWIAGTNAGVLLQQVGAPESGSTFSFRSSEDGTISRRPELTVTYEVVPEPGSMALCILGAGLFLGRPSRSK